MYECTKIYRWPCLACTRGRYWQRVWVMRTRSWKCDRTYTCGCWFWCCSKDYRLPQTDGISAFHALKQCAHLPIP
ncbi:hypothetical protein BJV78DRAFT_1252167 [Lactifluus subvellereus]|nr:hypothetical protein BJV78DRAFT_1252167 [Lactifluus subvellereus]